MKRIFISHSLLDEDEHALVEFLKLKLTDEGFEVLSFDAESIGQPLFETAQDFIRRASVVICVMPIEGGRFQFQRDGFATNSMFFELGYAMGIGRQVILLKRPDIAVPNDMRLLPIIQIDPYDFSFVYELIRQIRAKDFDVDRIDYLVRDKPESIIELFKNDKNAFERIDSRTFDAIIQQLFRRSGLDIRPAAEDSTAKYDFEITSSIGRTLVEVKKYTSNSRVSVGQVQQLMGAVFAERADRGLFISTSEFTNSAIDFANRCEPKIELWTMENLAKHLASFRK